MTFLTSKDGGDVTQVNGATQGNVSAQSVSGAASAGPAVVGSIGGAAIMSQVAEQLVDQGLIQANLGAAGNAGSDNTEANTAIGTF